MKILTTLLLLSISVSVLARDRVDKTLSVAEGGEVNISVISGDVKVSAWNRSEVKVIGDIGNNDDDFIFKTSGRETTIKVEPRKRFFGGNRYGGNVDIEIYVPIDSLVSAEGTSTDFKVNGIKGGLSAQTISGDFRIEGVDKNISLQSMSGDIEIDDSTATIYIETISGDIDAMVSAIRFDVTSVSGDIEANIGKSELVNATSVSGSVELTLDLDVDARMDIETVSGDIDLDFLKGVNARFSLETGPGGEIRNSISNDEPSKSFVGSERVKFKAGKGQSTVSVETMSGTISIDQD